MHREWDRAGQHVFLEGLFLGSNRAILPVLNSPIQMMPSEAISMTSGVANQASVRSHIGIFIVFPSTLPILFLPGLVNHTSPFATVFTSYVPPTSS